MVKTGLRLAALVLLLAALVLSLRLPVQGQEDWPCDQVIVDQANILAAGMDRVRAATNRLIDLGADVRVFTVQTTGLGDIALFVDKLQAQCQGWQTPDGQAMKNNLIVVGVSLDERQTAFYYGQAWFNLLDGEQERIQADLINSRFKEGDFAGGIAAGLEEVERLIDAANNPPPTAPIARPTERPLPTAPIAQPTERSSSTTPVASATEAPPVVGIVHPGSGAGPIVGIVVGVVAVTGGAAAGIVALLHARAARRQAQQRAREAKLKVASRVLELNEQAPYLEAEIAVVDRDVSTEKTSALLDWLHESSRLVKQVDADYASIQFAGNDPDREGLSRREYEGLATSYEELLAKLDQAGKAAAGVREQLQALRGAAEQAPAVLQQGQAGIEQADAQLQAAAREYPNQQARRLLEQAQARLGEGRANAADRRPEKALALAAEAAGLVEGAVAAAGVLAALRKRIAEVDAAIDAGAETFSKIAQDFAESSWQPIRGNGTEAENRVDWATEALQFAAGKLAGTEEAGWTEAQSRLGQAGSWLDEALGFMKSIQDMQQSLEKARQDAPQEVQSARQDVDKAHEYIGQYDPDIREQLEQDLDLADEELRLAESDLQQARPDYLQVVDRARKSNQTADKILAAARDEHEAIERLRSRYDSALREAQVMTSRALNYISNHDRDVGRQARTLLDEARAAYSDAEKYRAQAEASEDVGRRQALEEASSSAEKSVGQAQQAYSQARRDFDRAEEARRPKFSSSDDSWGGIWGSPRPSSGSSSLWGSSSSSSSHSGGSSSSWGSSRSSSSSHGGSSSSWHSSSSSSSRSRGGGKSGW